MAPFAYKFFKRVTTEARRRSEELRLLSGGQERSFVAYDWGSDTFVFEQELLKSRQPRAPVLIVPKRALVRERCDGYIMTATSGNHSVAALPLLAGQMWQLAHLQRRRRSEVMTAQVLCCNIVDDNLELSQRDVDIKVLQAADEWLRQSGWPLDKVVIAERSNSALELYRRLGQEWRIKPLAWTRSEMELALRASRARIGSCLTYYHSVKGVHFLTYGEFAALERVAEREFSSFARALAEIAGPREELGTSALRDRKFRHHHEIELFGIHTGKEDNDIIRQLELLQQKVASDSEPRGQLLRHFNMIKSAFQRSLDNPALAVEESELFVKAMYKHLTGEIYSGSRDNALSAFDGHRTALPGATYLGGKSETHPGIDSRTMAILNYVQARLSHGEALDYINVYEMRQGNELALGKGPTREVEYKTDRRPITTRLIEKRLAYQGTAYANYMLVRVQAFQSLGVAYGNHHLLARHDGEAREVHYFIRPRYAGHPYGFISPNHFRRIDCEHGVIDFPEAITALAAIMGNAAAQTLAVKRYIPQTNSVLFGEGKEIIEFGYDVQHRCELPTRVRLCSVRGTLGWPDLEETQENLERCYQVYLQAFARTLYTMWLEHADVVSLEEMSEHFAEGFMVTTRELYWNYANQREAFNSFNPDLRSAFKFGRKWRFALWALKQQYEQSATLVERLKRMASAMAADAEKSAKQ